MYCSGNDRAADRLPQPPVCPPENTEDPERIAIREALAFGKAV
jgi:hypothetical protein